MHINKSDLIKIQSKKKEGKNSSLALIQTHCSSLSVART